MSVHFRFHFVLQLLGVLTVLLCGRSVSQILTVFLCNTCLSDYRHLGGQHLWSTLGYFFKTLLKVLLIINIFPEVCHCLGHSGLVSLTAQFALKPLLW